MICTKCNRRLRATAVSCLCGWSASGSQPVQAVLACCFQNCIEGALCCVWTATGWANVCRTHYSKVEIVPRRVDSWLTLECRKDYEQSPDYRRRHGRTSEETIAREAEMRKRVDAELEALRLRNEASRQPGEDDEPAGFDLPLGIPRDPLEQEFMDRLNP